MRYLIFLVLMSGCAPKIPKDLQEAIDRADKANRAIVEGIKVKRLIDSRV